MERTLRWSVLVAAMAVLGCGSSGSKAAGGAGGGPAGGAGGVPSGNGGAGGNGGGAGAAPFTWAASGLDGAVVSTIAVDQTVPTTVFAGISAGGTGTGLWRSKDSGATWAKVAGLPDQYYGLVTICPTTHTVLANPGVEGIWRSNDGGETWTVSATALTDPGNGSALLCHPETNVVWTLSSQRGVYRSTDGGASFALTMNKNLPLNAFGLGPLAWDGSTLYLGTDQHGVYVSSDLGDTWVAAPSTGLPTSGATGSIINLGGLVSRRNLLYAKTNGALFRSLDGGLSFLQLTPEPGGVRYPALVLDPINPTVVYTSASDNGVGLGGLFESRDDGASWTNIGPAGQSIISVAVVPYGTLYAGTLGNGIWRYSR